MSADFLVEPAAAASWINGGGGSGGNTVNMGGGFGAPDWTNYSAQATNLTAQMVTPSSMLASTASSLLLLAGGGGTTASSTTISSNDTDPLAMEISETTRILVSTVVPVFFGFIGITGLLGNALVVLVVLSNPGMRSTTNLLIINLAIADLLFVVFCVPSTGTDYVLDIWPYGDAWCRMVQYLIVVTAHASIYTLVLMSLDRYLAVVHPIASMVIRTETHTMRAIFVLWFLNLTTAIPVLYIHGENETGRCGFIKDSGQRAVFHIAFFCSSYVVPLVLISVLYLRMLTRLWRNGVGGGSQRGRKRVTRMVVVVVAAFATLWLPIQIILVLKSLNLYETNTDLKVALQVTSHVMAYCSSCINPVLYAFLSENFRKAFRKVMYCGALSRTYTRHVPVHTRSTRTGSIPEVV